MVSGSANSGLAKEVGARLEVDLAETRFDRFPDGEIGVAVDPAIGGADLYLLQTLSPPVNDHLVELLLLADACRRQMPARITAVIPYLAYARKDRTTRAGEAVGLRVLASLLGPDRVDRVLVVDPHVAQIESILSVPVEVISAVPALATAIRDRVTPDTTVVAPDAGAVKLAQRFADVLDLSNVAVVLKDRRSGQEVDVTGLVGKGVNGPALLVDDMITTGNTIAAAAGTVSDRWDPSSLMIATAHGLLVDGAVDRIEKHSPSAVVMTDTVTHNDLPSSYHIAGVAGLLSGAIADLHRR